MGTIDVAVPKLWAGTYFPDWLLERRKRAETALSTVVADCYLAGVSTRRMDKLVKTLGIHSLSKLQVSRMAADLDEHVDQFRHRPLDQAGPFTTSLLTPACSQILRVPALVATSSSILKMSTTILTRTSTNRRLQIPWNLLTTSIHRMKMLIPLTMLIRQIRQIRSTSKYEERGRPRAGLFLYPHTSL